MRWFVNILLQTCQCSLIFDHGLVDCLEKFFLRSSASTGLFRFSFARRLVQEYCENLSILSEVA